MYVLVNLSLGNEKLRTALMARVELLEVLSETLVCLCANFQGQCLLFARMYPETRSRSQRS